jgi:hypothetical protein
MKRLAELLHLVLKPHEHPNGLGGVRTDDRMRLPSFVVGIGSVSSQEPGFPLAARWEPDRPSRDRNASRCGMRALKRTADALSFRAVGETQWEGFVASRGPSLVS